VVQFQLATSVVPIYVSTFIYLYAEYENVDRYRCFASGRFRSVSGRGGTLYITGSLSEDKHLCRRSVADVGRYKIIIIRVYYYIIIIVIVIVIVVVVIESASLHTATSTARKIIIYNIILLLLLLLYCTAVARGVPRKTFFVSHASRSSSLRGLPLTSARKYNV